MDPINLLKDYELCPFDLQKTVGKVDITLNDLFEVVYRAELEFPGIADSLGMPNFMQFYEEIKSPSSKIRDDLHYLGLYWNINYGAKKSKYGKPVNDLGNAEIFPQMEFHGVGGHYKDRMLKCDLDCKHHNNYTIELTPLNEIAHLSIKINPTIKYERMSLVVYPSLYQVINSIFYELTFCGYNPIERDGYLEELVKIKEEGESEILKDLGSEIIKDALQNY